MFIAHMLLKNKHWHFIDGFDYTWLSSFFACLYEVLLQDIPCHVFTHVYNGMHLWMDMLLLQSLSLTIDDKVFNSIITYYIIKIFKYTFSLLCPL